MRVPAAGDGPPESIHGDSWVSMDNAETADMTFLDGDSVKVAKVSPPPHSSRFLPDSERFFLTDGYIERDIHAVQHR